ncbi:4Fe-4S binding protein [candidate division WOR-3 bacterium]|nr:4Fe-4S binding protein [candidate division WOR-3 bacterium]
MNPDLCIICGECAKRCKYDAIKGEAGESPSRFLPFEIKQKECVRCGECVSICPTGAIEVISKTKGELITKQ